MSFFSIRPGRERQLRLAFSAVIQEDIERGICRLWQFVSDILKQRAFSTAVTGKVEPCVSQVIDYRKERESNPEKGEPAR